jgi:hypothetical protein
MIFGRPTNLWNSALGLLLNAIVYFHVFNVQVDVPGLAILNGLLLAFVGLVANVENGPTFLAGKPRK